MRANIRTMLKKNRAIASLYYKLGLPSGIPMKDLVKLRKMQLMRMVAPYTMLDYSRLSKLYELASYVEIRNIQGSVVECGVWNGGSAGVLASAIKHNPQRHLWLFDSWEGLPEPTELDISYQGQVGKRGMDLVFEHKVKELLLDRIKIEPSRVHFVKGWFHHTLTPSRESMGPIALLHLDCDWYESVLLCLEELYDRVVPGGFVAIDDYMYWKGCTRAVDEFLEKGELSVRLRPAGSGAVYFQKPA